MNAYVWNHIFENKIIPFKPLVSFWAQQGTAQWGNSTYFYDYWNKFLRWHLLAKREKYILQWDNDTIQHHHARVYGESNHVTTQYNYYFSFVVLYWRCHFFTHSCRIYRTLPLLPMRVCEGMPNSYEWNILRHTKSVSSSKNPTKLNEGENESEQDRKDKETEMQTQPGLLNIFYPIST